MIKTVLVIKNPEMQKKHIQLHASRSKGLSWPIWMLPLPLGVNFSRKSNQSDCLLTNHTTGADFLQRTVMR